ncbi:unnamed protein product [Protopolystoma xenopodis]|uniref:Uncharacterized protein n=1 Tax=Protopolystoma xenopodis TaxID=117903 RepID=A0A448X471_9PLAT|nr:unnamed protein product [Protopolystoma xenopodis]
MLFCLTESQGPGLWSGQGSCVHSAAEAFDDAKRIQDIHKSTKPFPNYGGFYWYRLFCALASLRVSLRSDSTIKLNEQKEIGDAVFGLKGSEPTHRLVRRQMTLAHAKC